MATAKIHTQICFLGTFPNLKKQGNIHEPRVIALEANSPGKEFCIFLIANIAAGGYLEDQSSREVEAPCHSPKQKRGRCVLSSSSLRGSSDSLLMVSAEAQRQLMPSLFISLLSTTFFITGVSRLTRSIIQLQFYAIFISNWVRVN